MIKFSNLKKFYSNKKVLVIGHTGFKGSWLSLALKNLNCKVYGISKSIPTKPSNYLVSGINKLVKNYYLDIRNIRKLEKKIKEIKPDIIFHLAAQSLVLTSYKDPYDTWSSNSFGTLNLLEILKNYNYRKKIYALIITSDKCYKNINKTQGYKEDESLGGHEPYGASKAVAEIIFNSYYQCFLRKKKFLSVATARAGNVIGGGDWSKNRIIPDLIKSINKSKKLNIRYPQASRPWQHVLDLVFGYIILVYSLKINKKISGESFNLGPFDQKNYTVLELLKEFKKNLILSNWIINKKNIKFEESGLLNLNVKKIHKFASWKNLLNFKNTVKLTAEWYKKYFLDPNAMKKYTLMQIIKYQKEFLKKK